MTRLPRLVMLLVVVLCAGALSACGNKAETGAIRTASNEGFYLDVGDLKYQVEVSRQLNPSDTEDKGYLEGLTGSERKLAAGQIWFGVFLRVENASKTPILPSRDISILDTQAHVYRPFALAATNLFAYRSHDTVPAKSLFPIPDTPPSDGPIGGVLVLFKLTNTTLDDRPLELLIKSRDTPLQTGIVNLDV